MKVPMRDFYITDKQIVEYQKTVDQAKELMGMDGSLSSLEFVEDIVLKDQDSISLLMQGNIHGVPYLGTDLMRMILTEIEAVQLNDVMAAVAFARPLTLQSGLFDAFVMRKKGSERVSYIAPDLQEILEETYGLVLFEDQYFKVMSHIANYSKDEALTFMRTERRSDKRTRCGKAFYRAISGKAISTEELKFFLATLYPYNRESAESIALLGLQAVYFMEKIPSVFTEILEHTSLIRDI